jgi:hypothetical protein
MGSKKMHLASVPDLYRRRRTVGIQSIRSNVEVDDAAEPEFFLVSSVNEPNQSCARRAVAEGRSELVSAKTSPRQYMIKVCTYISE